MELIKYPSLTAFQRTQKFYTPGGQVVVQEKLDGSNCAIQIGRDGTIILQSRNTILDVNNAGMFTPFVEWANQQDFSDLAYRGLTLYGEMVMNQNKLKYTKKQPFVLFDIGVQALPGDTYFLTTEVVQDCASSLGIPTVPELYAGPYENFDPTQFEDFVSHFDETTRAEGYVIKSYEGYKIDWVDGEGNAHEKQIPYIFSKHVRADYKEQNAAPKALKKVEEPIEVIAEMFVTEARIDKAKQFFAEQGIQPEPHQIIARVSQDIKNEESEQIKELLLKAYWKPIAKSVAQLVLKDAA